MHDVLPPHDDEAEAGALACVLLSDNGNDARALLTQLRPDLFYDKRHIEILRAMRHLEAQDKPIDVVTVGQRIKESKSDLGTEGLSALLHYTRDLPDKAPSAANFPAFLEILADIETRRAMLRDSAQLSQLARDKSIPPSQLVDAVRRFADAYNNDGGDALIIHKPNEVLAMTFDDSDRILGDRMLATGQSLVIAGAGGLGKSRFLLQLAAATIAGRQFIGLETRRPDLRWLLLQAENSNRRLHDDSSALRNWLGDDWNRVSEQLLITEDGGFLGLQDMETRRRIANAIRSLKPDVIAWDSLYSFGIGDLNRDEDMNNTLQAIKDLSRSGNPERAIVVLHHALTGKAGAARATGYDRSSHGRNSKVLFAWTRAQINLAPGKADTNDNLVVSCAKCSNGREFPKFAIRLNPSTMIYEPDPDFDLAAWQAEVTGNNKQEPLMTPDRVRELCSAKTKAELAHAIKDDCGCVRQVAYRYIGKAEKIGIIHLNKKTQTYEQG